MTVSKKDHAIEALVPGQGFEREMTPGETHEYTFELPAGHYAQIVVEQKGIDVALRLVDPEGSGLPEVDSPSGPQGSEVVSEVAKEGGLYGLKVISWDSEEAPGRYEIHMTEPRLANEEDRLRVQAEREFHEGENLRRNGKYGEAVPRYEGALADWRSARDTAWEAETLLRLGWVLSDSRDWNAALDRYLGALSVFRRIGNRSRQAATLNLVGQARMRLGDPLQALEDHREARQISAELEDLEGQAAALDNLGVLHKRAGRSEEAFRACEEALELWQKVGSKKKQATSSLCLGDLYLLRNDLEQALRSFEQARSLGEEVEDLRIQAIGLRRLGDVRDRLDRPKEALEMMERALELYRELRDRRGEANALTSIATVEMKEGDLTQAREHLEQALEIFRRLKEGHLEAVTLHKLGRVAFRAEDFDLAYQRHLEAIPLYRQYRDPQGESGAAFGVARALYHQGKLEEARDLLEDVTKAAETVRSASESLELRATYFASRAHYWELYIDTLMGLHERHPQDGFDVLAFEAAESWRARSFLDLLQEARVRIREGADEDLLEEERGLREQLDRLLANRLLELEGESRVTDFTDSIQLETQEILGELDRIHRKLRFESPKARDLIQPASLHLTEIREEYLGSDSLLLAYFLGPRQSYLWLVGERDFESFVLPDRPTIGAVAHEVQQHLRHVGLLSRDSETDALDRLNELILEPAAELLASGSEAPKRLVVVSDGALQYLPFAALRDPASEQAKPLVSRFEIIHLPSASVLASLRERRREQLRAAEGVRAPEDDGDSSHLIAVIADPVFQANRSGTGVPVPSEIRRTAEDLGITHIAPLPFTRDEATAILDMVSEDSRLGLLGYDASRDAVLSGELAPYSILHFATHGLVSSAHPELSGLVLSLVDARQQPQGGFLSLSDIYSLEISARLVVLSACDTGLGRELEGEGLMGLTRGFFHAGASGLVASLWQVDDRSTSVLMERFYQQMLKEGLAPAAALRQAQLSMLADESWSDPYFWAAFTFQGDWVAASLSDDAIEERLLGEPPPDDYQDDDLPPPRIRSHEPPGIRPVKK